METPKPTWRCAFVSVVLLTLWWGSAAAESVYSIGNSLTNDMVPDGVAAIAADSGSNLTVGFHIRAANSLTHIAANPTDITYTRGGAWTTALPGTAWDFVTMQPYFGAGSTLGSESAAIAQFIGAAQSGLSQNASFFIYAAWPSLGDTGGSYSDYWSQSVSAQPDQPTVLARQYFDNLYQQLSTEYQGSARIGVIPVGDVFARLDAEFRAGHYPGITSVNDLYRDTNHMGDVGRFVAAATAYSTLFGEPATASSSLAIYQAGLGGIALTPELAGWLEGIVWDVVSNDPRTNVAPVPLPAAGYLLLTGFLGLVGVGHRTARRSAYGDNRRTARPLAA
jgi:hypothetical protein